MFPVFLSSTVWMHFYSWTWEESYFKFAVLRAFCWNSLEWSQHIPYNTANKLFSRGRINSHVGKIYISLVYKFTLYRLSWELTNKWSEVTLIIHQSCLHNSFHPQPVWQLVTLCPLLTEPVATKINYTMSEPGRKRQKTVHHILPIVWL